MLILSNEECIEKNEEADNPFKRKYPYEIDNENISVPGWLGFLLVMHIPLVNIGVMIYYFFSEDESESKKNLCIAYLILLACALVVAFFCKLMGII